MMTSTPASSPATPGLSPSATEVLAATIASAVERQLTQYVSAMAQQVDATRQSVETSKQELRAEFQQQIQAMMAQMAAGQQMVEGHQQALQSVLEQRLTEFSQHQQVRLNEVENRVLETAAGGGSVDASEIVALREHIDGQSAAAHSRIDELHKATRRFDEQASALVQHVNDTNVALTQRMDEGNQALATAVEERLGFVRTTLEAVGPEVQRQLAEQTATMLQRVDFTEHKVTDRMLAMEERVNEQNGTKIAHLEATLGRIGSGFDDAMAALSQRMLELENRLYDAFDQIKELNDKVSSVDDKAMTAMREQLSAAVGEAMLVRIEIDRVVASTEDKIGKNSLRMAEIEALLADEMDVSASVQLERLEELERALTALDPDQFVRKTDPNAGSAARPAAASAPVAPTLNPVAGLPSTSLTAAPTPVAAATFDTLPGGSPTSSTEPSLSSF
ncbi:MAG: hypothetical protein WCC60_14215 [Ilumatobacteraceae bacterium]